MAGLSTHSLTGPLGVTLDLVMELGDASVGKGQGGSRQFLVKLFNVNTSSIYL